MSFAGSGEERSMLWLARVLLLFRLNFSTDSGGTKYVFVQYIKCTTALDEVDVELDCVCPRCSTTDEKDHRSVGKEKLDNKMELIVGWRFRVEPFKANCGALLFVRGNCGISLLSRPFPCPCHCFYINTLYRDDFLKLGSTK